MFEQLSEEYVKTAVFLKVDGDQLPQVIRAQNVQAYPTFKFFKNGKEVDVLQGASEESLRIKIEEHSPSASSSAAKSPYKFFPEKHTITLLKLWSFRIFLTPYFWFFKKDFRTMLTSLKFPGSGFS